MRYLWLALFLSCLGIAPARAQTNCPAPMTNFVAIPVVSAAAEGSHILKASPGCLISVYINNTGVAGLLLVINSKTVPADGAVTPIECIPVAATTGYQAINLAPGPAEYFSAGIVVVLSTNASCFTKAVGSGAFFHAFIQ